MELTEEEIQSLLNGWVASLRRQLAQKRQNRGFYGELKRGYSNWNATGSLSKSLSANIQTINGEQQLVLSMDKQGIWVDEGRRPGRWPPVQPIDRWTIVKGLAPRTETGRFMERKSLVFLIRRSIGELGYKGSNFLVDGTLNYIDKLSDGLTQVFVQKLEKLIIKYNE